MSATNEVVSVGAVAPTLLDGVQRYTILHGPGRDEIVTADELVPRLLTAAQYLTGAKAKLEVENTRLTAEVAALRAERDALREQWADYFETRSRKSVENARAVPDTSHWLDVAAGERACAEVLRSGRTLAECFAALATPARPTDTAEGA